MQKLIFAIVFFVSLFCLNQTIFAYDDKTTHPALTEQIVDFYNYSSNKKITNEEKEWIIQGSILEDTEPRYINHFYDPIRNEGWTGEHGAGWISKEVMQKFSKLAVSSEEGVSTLNWVHNQELQDKYKDYQGNQTWEKALYEYVKTKDKQKAFTSLGYVLHLLEDMSVPDHTRNDTHPGDSPYENYATKFSRGILSIANDLKNQNIQSFKFDSLDRYFEIVANYSNGYFFSKDTINDPKYENPKIIEEKDGWAYGKDENKQNFILSVVTQERINEYKIKKIYFIEEAKKYDSLFNSYFSHLSREAVLAGSGVVDLFFKEAAKIEKDLTQLETPPENSSKIFSLLGWSVQAKNYISLVAQKTGKTLGEAFNKIAGIFKSMPASVVSSVELVGTENLGTSPEVPIQVTDEIISEIKEKSAPLLPVQVENPKVEEDIPANQPVQEIPVVVPNENKKENPATNNIYYGAGYAGDSSADTTAPVITLAGSDPLNVFKNSTYTDLGATANDDKDGVTSVVTTGSVDTSIVGAYILTYTATDNAGNVATLTRTVNVVADTTSPVITLNGNSVESIRKNLTYNDAGATALDNTDGTVNVTTSGNVDTTAVGIYTITYDAIDSSGNTATKTRTVVVDNGALLDQSNFVTVSGNYAYVVSERSNSFEIIDISNPAELVHKSSAAHRVNGFELFAPKSVAVSGNYAYVTTYGNSVEVIDITNPILPIHKTTLSNGTGGAQLVSPNKITISGNYAYVVAYGSQVIEILDISDPINPTHKGSYSLGVLSYPSDVVVLNNYMYIVSTILGQSDGSLHIVDISNPSAPVWKSTLNNGTSSASIASPQSIFISGNYAYIVSRATHGIEIVDITDPLNPLHKSFIKDEDTGAYLHVPKSVAVSGNYAYVTLFNGSALEVLNVSDPFSPTHVVTLPNKITGASLDYTNNIFISGNYAYITSSSDDALEIVDISNPNNPIHAGKIFQGEFTHTTSSTVFSSEKKILSFNLTELNPDVIGVVDENNHTVTLTVPNGTNVTSLSPEFTISTNAASVPGLGETKDFTNPRNYLIYAEDGSTQNYVVTVNISAPPPDTTAPSITGYTFNGAASDITANPITDPITLVFNANENVNWMSIKIEKQDDSSIYKIFQSGPGCLDGSSSCTKTWDGELSSGGLLQNGTYRIKVHIKDSSENEFYDYVTPYVINVSIPPV